MKNDKMLLFLMDDNFNGFNTINACILNYLHRYEISYTWFLESLYIKKVSKERYYKVDVRKRTNSRGFEVIVDFNMTCPVIDGNESIDFDSLRSEVI